HPIEGMREAVAADRSREWRGPFTSTTASNQSANGGAITARSGRVGEVIEETRVSAMPVTAAPTPGAGKVAETHLAQRRAGTSARDRSAPCRLLSGWRNCPAPSSQRCWHYNHHHPYGEDAERSLWRAVRA